ncbi:sce7726 family protein [Photobacterium phosphoreum]|uniref:sce7726 family protein n=1 Tax=Photobacterium phosphoreum TaxID=659 RepID=UPI000D1628A9|nr:sce7726 family protein [Photobacterium phosphoreum]PTB33065.1 hypothetical protein DAT36_08455 [Photobacterium phosphoreum]
MSYKYLAKLFTSAEISRIASGDMTNLKEILTELPELAQLDTLADVYESSYKLLCKHYPNEYVIKNTIANKILLGTHSMNTASMLSELRIGDNKADCVIINGISTCYEIKTQYDSLKRLPEQLATYTKSFDKTYVVTHDNHLDALIEYQSQYPQFGIIHANNKGNLSIKIEAPINMNFNTEMMFHSLRKEEYTQIAKDVLGFIPNVPPAELFSECQKIFCSLSSNEANSYFKATLKHFRKNDHKFINLLPKSMKNLGISYKIHKKDKERLISSCLHNSVHAKGDIYVLPILSR